MKSKITLMDRAKALLTSGTTAAIAIIPLGAATELFGGDPHFKVLESTLRWGTGSAFAGPHVLSGLTAPDGDSVKFTGSAGPIAGTDWVSNTEIPLLFNLDGINEVPPENGDFAHINYSFDIAFTGDNVAWHVWGAQRIDELGIEGVCNGSIGWPEHSRHRACGRIGNKRSV